MTNTELLSRYAADLEILQILLRLHHDHGWVRILQSWREEFEREPDTVAVKAHAARTARALGGMGSIGDGLHDDRVMMSLIGDLHSLCDQISSSLP